MIQPANPETLLPIDCLRSNERASVVELMGDSREVHRLSEVGLRVGAEIRMIRPGAPCLLAIDGQRLSIRLGRNVEVLVAPKL